MDALVAEYGEEDVMRWCETGRLVEEMRCGNIGKHPKIALIRSTDSWQVAHVDGLFLRKFVSRGISANGALKAAQE